MDYKNEIFLIWETNPEKRNTNNEVCISVLDDKTIQVGDRFFANKHEHAISTYEIIEILEQRPSAIKGRNFLRAKTKWYMLPLEAA